MPPSWLACWLRSHHPQTPHCPPDQALNQAWTTVCLMPRQIGQKPTIPGIFPHLHGINNGSNSPWRLARAQRVPMGNLMPSLSPQLRLATLDDLLGFFIPPAMAKMMVQEQSPSEGWDLFNEKRDRMRFDTRVRQENQNDKSAKWTNSKDAAKDYNTWSDIALLRPPHK